MNIRKSILVAMTAVTITSTVAVAGLSWSGNAPNPRQWTSASSPTPGGPKSPLQFFAKHVAKMRANHPGATFETTGYQYASDPTSGQLITGIQVRLAEKGEFMPCWYFAVWNPSGQTNAGSCRGN